MPQFSPGDIVRAIGRNGLDAVIQGVSVDGHYPITWIPVRLDGWIPDNGTYELSGRTYNRTNEINGRRARSNKETWAKRKYWGDHLYSRECPHGKTYRDCLDCDAISNEMFNAAREDAGIVRVE